MGAFLPAPSVEATALPPLRPNSLFKFPLQVLDVKCQNVQQTGKPPIVCCIAWSGDKSFKENQTIIGLCLKRRLNADKDCVDNFVADFCLITQTNLILSWEIVPLNIQQKLRCSGDMVLRVLFVHNSCSVTAFACLTSSHLYWETVGASTVIKPFIHPNGWFQCGALGRCHTTLLRKSISLYAF